MKRSPLTGRSWLPTLGTLLVTADAVSQFERDGVVVVRQAFSPEWVEKMRSAFGEAMQKPGKYAEFMCKDTTWDNLFDKQAKPEPGQLEMFQDQLFWQETAERVPAWADIVKNSPAAETIAALMGSESASFFYAHLIVKCGGTDKAIPWHQDLPYWKIMGSQVGSVWIALDDMPAEASVEYVNGSHRWGLFQPRHFVDASPYQGRDLPSLPNIDTLIAEKKVETVRYAVKAGDCLCFDSRIVHGSAGNPEPVNQDHRRVALRFGGDDACYNDQAGETAIPTPEVEAVHGLSHGDPLSCAAFPTVWPPDDTASAS